MKAFGKQTYKQSKEKEREFQENGSQGKQYIDFPPKETAPHGTKTVNYMSGNVWHSKNKQIIKDWHLERLHIQQITLRQDGQMKK